jgi:hypothetical protein
MKISPSTLRRLAKLEAQAPVEAVDDGAVLARIMDDLERTHERQLASGDTPPTAAQLNQSGREFEVLFQARP